MVLRPNNSHNWTIYLKATSLPSLKNNPYFLDLIKVARVINNLNFASQCMSDNEQRLTPSQRRQFQRGIMQLAAYTHQALQLGRSIQARYLTVSDFQLLRNLIHDSLFRRGRHLVKSIRNEAAFHTDEYDVTTREALAGIEPGRYELVSGENDSHLSYHFELADTIDAMYLIKKLGKGHDQKEKVEEFWNTVLEFCTEVQIAFYMFADYLMKSSDLSQYVEGRQPFQRTFVTPSTRDTQTAATEPQTKNGADL
jgi:hypothetical protein